MTTKHVAVHVLDTGALMNTSIIPQISGDIYIPSKVVSEVRSSQAKNILDVLQGRFEILILDPPVQYTEKIEDTCSLMGQHDLSPADIDVLAISLWICEVPDTDTDVILHTDDFAVRNIAHELGIKSISSISGGEEKRKYKFKCLACGRFYKIKPEDCEICGHLRFRRYRR